VDGDWDCCDGDNVLPCAATPVDVGGVTYFACGTSWYTQAYASSGVTYVQAAPPPAY